MKTNLKVKQDFNPETWQTLFTSPDLKSMHDNAVEQRRVDGESTLRLVTRSGFETKHICTSAVSSL